MSLKYFWDGFSKVATIKGVFKGLAKATEGPTLNYAAIKAEEAAKKMATNPNVLKYTKGADPKFVAGSGQAESQLLEGRYHSLAKFRRSERTNHHRSFSIYHRGSVPKKQRQMDSRRRASYGSCRSRENQRDGGAVGY